MPGNCAKASPEARSLNMSQFSQGLFLLPSIVTRLDGSLVKPWTSLSETKIDAISTLDNKAKKEWESKCLVYRDLWQWCLERAEKAKMFKW